MNSLLWCKQNHAVAGFVIKGQTRASAAHKNMVDKICLIKLPNSAILKSYMTEKIEFSLYKHVPAKAQIKLFAAIFFTFAPLALLTTSPIGAGMPWQLLTVWMLFSGIIAIGWAFSFIRNLKFLFLVIPLQLVFISTQMALGMHYRVPQPTIYVAGFLTMALIVIGYIFYVSYINSEGARSFRLQTEINLAKDIHDHLVPPINFSNDKVEIYGISVAAGEVGGDLLDLVQKDGVINCFVADVSGHGVRAGVMMGMMKSAIRMKMIDPEVEPKFVDLLNDVLYELKRPDMFATFAGIRIDNAGKISYINAGHQPIFHYIKSGKRLSKMESTYPPLAVLPGLKFEAIEMNATTGDLLVLITDGFEEVFDKQGNVFGLERLQEVLLANADKPLKEIYETVVVETAKFGAQSDDQTLLAIRIK